MKTNVFSNFATNAYREFYKPISQKIGEYSQIFGAFVIFLSIVNIAAGFMFFFAPILAVTENKILAAVVSIIILLVIEITSLWTFQESIMSISYEPKKIVGYLLATVALVILVFNVVSTAEGNKETIQAMAHKTQRLETLHTDTLNYTANYFENKLQNLDVKLAADEQRAIDYYTTKIAEKQKEIDESKSMNKGGDYVKNTSATKARNLFEKQLEEKKNSLQKAYMLQRSEIKQTQDSVLHLLNLKIKTQISESKQITAITGNFHYRIGFVLVFLIIISRALFVYAQIDTAKLIKQKNGKLQLSQQTYDLDQTTEAVMISNYEKIIAQANQQISLNGKAKPDDADPDKAKKLTPTPQPGN